MGCKPIDIKGKKFNRLTAVGRTGERNKKGSMLWQFVCECGTIKIHEAYAVTSGNIKSCGCYSQDVAGKQSLKHGWSGTKQYAVWSKIKARILDHTNPSYPDYGGRGLTISKEFVDNMNYFYECLGPKPEDGQRYTVGRIDNDVGYIVGNIRWEKYTTQNRNVRKRSTNSSNCTGVVWTESKSKNSKRLYAVARWQDGEKQMTKGFSVKSLGLIPAFHMACCYREKMIAELNKSGAGYSEKHGK